MGSQSARVGKNLSVKNAPSTQIKKSVTLTKKQQKIDIFNTTGEHARYDGKDGVFYVNKSTGVENVITDALNLAVKTLTVTDHEEIAEETVKEVATEEVTA